MRITGQYLYNNFNLDQQKVNKELKKVTEQISSGQKIQTPDEDPSVYDDTLRLDTQINELKSVQERVKKAQQFTTATDTTLQDFTDSLRRFKTRVLAAVNDTANSDNREAIAAELTEERNHLMRLANTQVGGEYLFAGSATHTKPIDENGRYMGNDKQLQTVIGEGVTLPYNIDGKSLFLGSDDSVQKRVETNIPLKNAQTGETLTASDTLADLAGGEGTLTFYLSGMQHDGTAVKEKFSIDTNQSIDTLLEKIGVSYGNTTDAKSVDVAINQQGNIVVTDLHSGKSQLMFKLRAEYDDGSGTTKPIDFIKSGYEYADAANPDSAYFVKKGSVLTGNVSLLANGKTVDASTKLEAIANGSLQNKSFIMKLTDINGDAYSVSLDLDSQSSFTVTGSNGSTTYNIYNADGSQTSNSDMTMGQLSSVISMVTSGQLPTSTNSADDFNSAVDAAQKVVSVGTDQDGRLQITDKSNNLSKITFAIYDPDASDFNVQTPTIAFHTNDAITTRKPQMDFFAQLDEIIDAVRTGKGEVDANTGDPRNIGMENALAQLDQFDAHFNTQLAKVGTIENSLTNASDRATSMEVSLKELKSDLTDVDIAEAYLRLTQISQSYQAILSSVTKINALTLLNYMK